MIKISDVIFTCAARNAIFYMIFCVDRFSESSTMEQLDLRTVRAIIDNTKKIM